jgi:type II secretion system protein G
MLVLVILGILAGLVLPKFAGRSEQARITATVTQIATFNTALGAYEVDTGAYPASQDGLLARAVPAKRHPPRSLGASLCLPVPGQAQPERLRHHLDGARRTARHGG